MFNKTEYLIGCGNEKNQIAELSNFASGKLIYFLTEKSYEMAEMQCTDWVLIFVKTKIKFLQSLFHL